jgi:hypothetical protein
MVLTSQSVFDEANSSISKSCQIESFSDASSLQRDPLDLAQRKSASLVGDYRVSQTFSKRVVLGKRRSKWFYLAKETFFTVGDLGFVERDKLSNLVVYYDRWRESYQRKFVHLEREDNTHIFIKQYSRFEASYREFLRRKLKLLNFMLWDLKIELTIDPKKFLRLADEFNFLKKAWNRLNSWLRKKFGEFEYFKVMEIQKSGRPHFHVLISGIKWIDQKELSDTWSKYGGGEIVYIKRVSGRNNLKMSAYVMKYVNKTLKKSDKVFSALLFASNKRLFSMSSGCQNMLNAGRIPKKPKGFVFSGSVREEALIEFCDEEAFSFEAFMVVEANFEDYRQYPLVFGGSGYG